MGPNDSWERHVHHQKEHCKTTEAMFLKNPVVVVLAPTLDQPLKVVSRKIGYLQSQTCSPYGSSSGVCNPSCRHTTQHPGSLAKFLSSRAISHSLGPVAPCLRTGSLPRMSVIMIYHVQWISSFIMLYSSGFIFIILYH